MGCRRRKQVVQATSYWLGKMSRSVFPLSWSLEETYLDLKEFWVSYWTEKKENTTSYSHSLQRPGAQNPERSTSMRLSHGVFTDQYILRTVLTRILNIFKIPQTSQQNLQT